MIVCKKIFNFENFIASGPEYGTTEAAWKAVLVEADRRCELHIKVKDNLLNEVFFGIFVDWMLNPFLTLRL